MEKGHPFIFHANKLKLPGFRPSFGRRKLNPYSGGFGIVGLLGHDPNALQARYPSSRRWYQ